MLSRKGWKYEIQRQGRTELHRIERDATKYVIQIRILSKVAPVPFPQGLSILDSIDYLVICNNLKTTPNLIVLEPNTIRQIIHKDTINEIAYWLQSRDYNRCGTSFEQVFG